MDNDGILPHVPMLETTPVLFDKVYQVDFTGVAFCAKAAASWMVEQAKGGKIINNASVDGIHPSMIGVAAYGSSKGGVVMFTEYLALEMAHVCLSYQK